MNFLQKIIANLPFLRPHKFKIQTFTYYIPSPPQRTFGYREKQFDKVFYDFINQGFEIISMRTEQNTSPTHSGMWVIFAVRALNAKAEKLNFDDLEFPLPRPEKNQQDAQDGPIQGLYHLDSSDD